MPKHKQTNNKTIDNKVFVQVSNIIQFMGESNLSEISLETSDVKLHLRKNSNKIIQTIMQPEEVQTKQIVETKPVSTIQNKQKQTKTTLTDENVNKIITPMTGNFYQSPSPDSPPFVNEGDKVVKGQTVCIVEAMKMMNEIKSDFNGKILKILVENGKSVEKGATLFHVEKEG